MKRFIIFFSLMVSLVAVPMAGYSQTPRTNLLVGSFMPGQGVIYEIAVTVGDYMSKHTNLDMTVKSYSGPSTILQALGSGKIHIASAAKAGTAANAYYGIEEFQGKPIRSLRAVISQFFIQQTWVTTPRTGIKTIPDLKGKKIAQFTATPNEWADALLEVHGINPEKDVQKVRVSDAIAGFKEIQTGRLDAAHGTPWNLGALAIKEQVGRVVVVPIPRDKLSAAIAKYPKYFLGAYTGYIKPGDVAWVELDEPVPLMESPHSVYTMNDMDEEVVHTYTKAMLNWQEVRNLCKSLQFFTPDLFQKPLPVPFHSGAIKAFKEKGMWTEEMQESHQKALSASY